jgi:hypothetical protein
MCVRHTPRPAFSARQLSQNATPAPPQGSLAYFSRVWGVWVELRAGLCAWSRESGERGGSYPSGGRACLALPVCAAACGSPSGAFTWHKLTGAGPQGLRGGEAVRALVREGAHATPETERVTTRAHPRPLVVFFFSPSRPFNNAPPHTHSQNICPTPSHALRPAPTSAGAAACAPPTLAPRPAGTCRPAGSWPAGVEGTGRRAPSPSPGPTCHRPRRRRCHPHPHPHPHPLCPLSWSRPRPSLW